MIRVREIGLLDFIGCLENSHNCLIKWKLSESNDNDSKNDEGDVLVVYSEFDWGKTYIFFPSDPEDCDLTELEVSYHVQNLGLNIDLESLPWITNEYLEPDFTLLEELNLMDEVKEVDKKDIPSNIAVAVKNIKYNSDKESE